MQVMSERYAAAVKVAAGITSTRVLTVSMVAYAADQANVNPSAWFPPLPYFVRAA